MALRVFELACPKCLKTIRIGLEGESCEDGTEASVWHAQGCWHNFQMGLKEGED
jgi:hypothetical protein